MENNRNRILKPILYSLLILIGVLIGRFLNSSDSKDSLLLPRRNSAAGKFSQTLHYLKNEYVDTIDEKILVEDAINAMLQKLDPHSFYIPSEELTAVNESLEGGFEGIGIEFNIFQDTIVVVSPISGGPSEQLGIKSGDRIVRIEGKPAAGVGITNKEVVKKLRGTGGTKVSIEIKRNDKLIPLTITRGKIPLYSLDAAYMEDDKTGYIRINRFAETTFEEYQKAFTKLKSEGLKNLILDLRNNPGGYLQAANLLTDEFLDEGKIIVYTQGKSRPKKEYKASSEGDFENGKLIILIDEGSASASEIVSGAVQDWDRGTIIGRRSFGKGLVQDQTILPDSSALRLTIARYYTPSGRCIQKPYKDGIEKYRHELTERLENGELENPDTTLKADSLEFKTLVKGRKVYGGGGISPDIFVPIDTSMNSEFLGAALNSGVLTKFVFDYTTSHESLGKKYKNAADFRNNYEVSDELYSAFVEKVKSESTLTDAIGVNRSAMYLRNIIKALIARAFWQGEGYYSVLNDEDMIFKKAMETINLEK